MAVFADCFAVQWNFPHNLGALDDIHIKNQNKSGLLFFDYKRYFLFLMLCSKDPDMQVGYVKLWAEGSCSDAGMINQRSRLNGIENKHSYIWIYYIMSDGAFRLQTWMMKPQPGSHLLQEKRIFKSAFLVLSQR